jgi:hypothetical protein
MIDDELRYVVGLRDKEDTQCYKDFFETEKFEEGKRKAEELFERYRRSIIIFDRKLLTVIFRKELKKGEIEKQKKKDVYFE